MAKTIVGISLVMSGCMVSWEGKVIEAVGSVKRVQDGKSGTGLVVGMGNGMRLHDSRVAMLLAVASLLRMIRLIWRSVMTYIHGR